MARWNRRTTEDFDFFYVQERFGFLQASYELMRMIISSVDLFEQLSFLSVGDVYV